jgi:hypothetical protein
MFLHVEDVHYEGDHKLRLTFDDGVVKVVDLDAELDGPVFEPLRDPALFRKATVNPDTGTIEWPNGADFAPEFLYEIGKTVHEPLHQKVAEGRAKYGKQD